MLKKITCFVTILAFLLSLQGCYKEVTLTPKMTAEEFEEEILSIQTSGNCNIKFKDFGAIANGSVTGTVRDGSCFNIPVDKVDSIKAVDGEYISPEKIYSDPDKYQVEEIKFKNGEVYKLSGIFLRNGNLSCHIAEWQFVEVSLKNVSTYIKEESDSTPVVLLALAGAFVLVIALVSKEPEKPKPPTGSCPFIYSFDSEKFVMDAEPFGGSVCEALRRTDFCRLNNSHLVNNKYVFKVTNERDEIQYIDEFNLYVIDHQPQYTVIPDSRGNFYLIEKPLQPEQVFINGKSDSNGLIMHNDQQYWSSDLAQKVNMNVSDFRDEIVMTFSKPKDAAKCNLIVKGCNTDWSSHILMKVLELAGKNNAQFTNPGILDQIKWISVEQREELFHLKAQVWSGEDWSAGGIISGGGSVIAETQVIPLDLTGVKGDYLKIRINPPAGFWKFDWIAVDYIDNRIEDIKEIKALYAKGDDKRDIVESIKASDKRYYVMSQIGDGAVVIFDAPPAKEGLSRSVFAKVSGYYSMNIKGEGAARLDILDRIVNEPGFVVKYLLMEFSRWNEGLMAGLTN